MPQDVGHDFDVNTTDQHQGHHAAGEVKQPAADFDPKQVRGDIEKCARTGADIHIMVTPGQISASSLDLAHRLRTQAGLELMVLQRTGLRLAPGHRSRSWRSRRPRRRHRDRALAVDADTPDLPRYWRVAPCAP